MKSTQTMRKTMVGAARGGSKIRFNDGEVVQFSDGPKKSVIQWPSEQEIQKVPKKLSKINRGGIRWEANGDYFKSGDLAYQTQEITRATAELFKKSQRLKR